MAVTVAAQEPVASIRELEVGFPNRGATVHAVRGVSLDVFPGEVVALVGESGSGKTVLTQALMGLLPPTAQVRGSVTIGGVDMVAGPGVERRAVRRELLGAVFQDALQSLNPTMSVGRQITERGISRQRALRHLAEAGLPGAPRRFGQFPHELSGGMRQRAMIAMALGGSGSVTRRDDGDDGSPQLIVADEPTTALDVSVQAQILVLFDRLRREHGAALLLVSHDLGVAASIADRIMVMYAGRVAEAGVAADILRTPTHPYTDALLFARQALADETLRRPDAYGEPPDPTHPLPGCAFAPRCHRATDECRAAQPALASRVGTRRSVAACIHPLLEPPELREIVIRGPLVPAPVDPNAAVELREVWKRYAARTGRGTLTAVAGVSLRVPSGGSVAVVGESGSGKTTLLRIAAGLIKPDDGVVAWPAGGRRPQMIFQDASSSLTPWMTIEEQISERLVTRGVAPSARATQTLELLEHVGLDRRAARARPRELSGGQKQRASIARALASDPQLLICDEPVSALDASLAVRVLDLLRDLRRDLGLALLLVTHDLAAARYVADEIKVMYLGRLVESAPKDSLFATPTHPYTRGLLAAVPSVEPGRLAPVLTGEPPDGYESLVGCAFAPRCAFATDRCRVELPLLRAVGESLVACHHAEQVVAAAGPSVSST